MQVRDVMSREMACCTPEMGLREVARMMVACDCGAIPVLESRESRRPIGVVTDRDIVCRLVAEGRNPLESTAGDCMSRSVICGRPGDTLEEAGNIMEERQIRRLMIIDDGGNLIGILAQADLARNAPAGLAAEMLRDVSAPSDRASSTLH